MSGTAPPVQNDHGGDGNNDNLQRRRRSTAIGIIQDLRNGVCDVLVDVNLPREGLDLPEFSLLVIVDADKEGFLRA